MNDYRTKNIDVQEIIQSTQCVLDTFTLPVQVVATKTGHRHHHIKLATTSDTAIAPILNLQREFELSLAAGAITITLASPTATEATLLVTHTARPEPIPLLPVLAKLQQSHAATLTIPIGQDDFGEPVALPLTQHGAVVVSGTTGSGKSNLMHVLIHALLQHPEEMVALTLIDPKRVEYGMYERLPRLANACHIQIHDGIRALRAAAALVEERRDDSTVRHLPRHVVIIDELSDLMHNDQATVMEATSSIATYGAATNIHMIVTTSRPSQTVLPPELMAQIPVRIAHNAASTVDSYTVCGRPEARQLRSAGDALYVDTRTDTPIRFQGYHLSETDIAETLGWTNK